MKRVPKVNFAIVLLYPRGAATVNDISRWEAEEKESPPQVAHSVTAGDEMPARACRAGMHGAGDKIPGGESSRRRAELGCSAWAVNRGWASEAES
jgi:hypothetical protein